MGEINKDIPKFEFNEHYENYEDKRTKFNEEIGSLAKSNFQIIDKKDGMVKNSFFERVWKDIKNFFSPTESSSTRINRHIIAIRTLKMMKYGQDQGWLDEVKAAVVLKKLGLKSNLNEKFQYEESLRKYISNNQTSINKEKNKFVNNEILKSGIGKTREEFKNWLKEELRSNNFKASSTLKLSNELKFSTDEQSEVLEEILYDLQNRDSMIKNDSEIETGNIIIRNAFDYIVSIDTPTIKTYSLSLKNIFNESNVSEESIKSLLKKAHPDLLKGGNIGELAQGIFKKWTSENQTKDKISPEKLKQMVLEHFDCEAKDFYVYLNRRFLIDLNCSMDEQLQALKAILSNPPPPSPNVVGNAFSYIVMAGTYKNEKQGYELLLMDIFDKSNVDKNTLDVLLKGANKDTTHDNIEISELAKKIIKKWSSTLSLDDFKNQIKEDNFDIQKLSGITINNFLERCSEILSTGLSGSSKEIQNSIRHIFNVLSYCVDHGNEEDRKKAYDLLCSNLLKQHRGLFSQSFDLRMKARSDVETFAMKEAQKFLEQYPILFG